MAKVVKIKDSHHHGKDETKTTNRQHFHNFQIVIIFIVISPGSPEQGKREQVRSKLFQPNRYLSRIGAGLGKPGGQNDEGDVYDDCNNNVIRVIMMVMMMMMMM